MDEVKELKSKVMELFNRLLGLNHYGEQVLGVTRENMLDDCTIQSIEQLLCSPELTKAHLVVLEKLIGDSINNQVRYYTWMLLAKTAEEINADRPYLEEQEFIQFIQLNTPMTSGALGVATYQHFLKFKEGVDRSNQIRQHLINTKKETIKHKRRTSQVHTVIISIAIFLGCGLYFYFN